MQKAFIQALQFQFYHRWKDRAWEYPAREFEQQTGMTGISRDYKMPPGRSADELGKYVCYAGTQHDLKNVVLYHTRPQFRALFQKAVSVGLKDESWKDEMREDLEKIIEMNPELRSIKYDPKNSQEVFDVLMGVCSGFNPEDIDFFISCSQSYKPDIDAMARENLLNQKLGGFLTWAPAPSTLETIKEHFGLSGWEPSQQEISQHKQYLLDHNPHLRAEI